MGRRSKLTPQVQKAFLTSIKLGSTIEYSAKMAGIGVSTVYRWLESGRNARSPTYVEFWEAYQKAEGEALARSLACIQQAAKAGSWQAAAWLCERRYGYNKAGAAAESYKPPKAKGAKLDPLEQLVEARTRAMEAGSYVAGAALLREEARLRAEAEAAEVERAKTDRAGIPAGALLEELAGILKGLPEGARAELLELVDA